MDGKISKLSAKKLRVVLIASIVVMLLIGAGVFWFFRGKLVEFAVDVQTASVAANTSSSDVEKLRGIQAVLDKDQVAVSRAKKIVAASKFYQYQDQIVTDLTKYATDAGVRVTAFSFNDSTTAQGAPQTAPTPTVSGLKSTTVNVTIENPVGYSKIMDFIHYIEENLTKMQLSGVTISKANNNINDNSVSVSPLTIEVYTK